MEYLDPKQPYEEYYIEFNFKNDIVIGDSIETAAATVTPDGLVIDHSIQSIDGNSVYVWVSSGNSKVTYVISCKIVTVNGEKYELDAQLPVVEEV